MKNKAFLIFAIATALTVGITYSLFMDGQSNSPRASALALGDELRGFAWSSNAGWISFNCADTLSCGKSNYRVLIDGSGALSGFAWSSGLGWIDVNPASGYPEAPAHGMQVSADGTVTGWMRACAGAANTVSCSGGSVNGYDGWIKVIDAKVGLGGFMKNSAGTDGGWAWGSDSIGVVRFYNPANGNGVVVPFAPAFPPIVTGDNELSGFAWSSTVGWISFNCANTYSCGNGSWQSSYKVTMDGSGKLHGYAWSSSIGWISVDPVGANGRPSDAHGLQVATDGTVTGWMRACAGAANAASCSGGSVNGHDGWIKIVDAKVGQDGFIKNSAGTDGGWAWGSDFVGWIQLSNPVTKTGVMAPRVTCDFSANPAFITPPQGSKLVWSCNAHATPNKCSISGGVGNNLPVSGDRTVRPAVDTTYTLTCQGLNGPFVATADVTIGSASKASTSTIRIIEVNP